MKIRAFLLSLIILGMISGSSKAYVYGYKKLYRKSTNTVVELLYDYHQPIADIIPREFYKLDLNTAIKKFYPTEQKFLEVLQKWEADSFECDLIWEKAAFPEFLSEVFIGMPPFLGIDKMKHVNYIPADNHRQYGFYKLFSVDESSRWKENCSSFSCIAKKHIQSPQPSLTKSSFFDPAPHKGKDTARIRIIYLAPL